MVRQTPLFALGEEPSGTPEALELAAEATVTALREQHAIQPWHELDVAIVVELAKAVGQHRGIAKSQMFGALLQARSRLPEPVVQETDVELVQYEAQRVIAWARGHSADVADIEDAVEVD